jgi:hypothetical protein
MEELYAPCGTAADKGEMFWTMPTWESALACGGSAGNALTMLPRRAFHRTALFLAGIYNICWGLWTAWDPQWFFRFTGLAPLNHPEIFACLGMVIGLYGILYLEVARRPEQGWLIAAIGLAGKVLGPIGLARLILQGQWPPSAVVLSLTNDLIWWVPFSLYLRDAWPGFRATLGAGMESATDAPPRRAAGG